MKQSFFNKLRQSLRQNFMMFAFISAFILSAATSLNAQTSVSLNECYEWARAAFPLLKQKDIVAANAVLQAKNASLLYLPQASLNAQATYQSAVTEFTLPIKIPGFEPNPPSKDQYKATLDVQQIIWDGGAIAQQKQNIAASSATETQRIEVEAYKTKERINQLFFSVLQIDENIKLLQTIQSDLATRIKKTTALVENGTSLKSPLYSLQAENLKNEQRVLELLSQRAASIGVLNVLMNKNLAADAVLTRPDAAANIAIAPDLAVARPELKLFELQKSAIDQQVKLTSLKNYPRVQAFGTVGYGKPALNFLKNEFEPYGIGGIQFKWNLQDLYNPTLKNELQILKANKDIADLQRTQFVQATQANAKQYTEEITKLQMLIVKDKEIIALREKIKAAASAQLDNGVINTVDYLLELNAENQAKQNLILHDIQLLAAKVYLQTLLGN